MYDTRLVVAAQEGDDAAFAALYDRNAEAVYDFCWALTGDEHEACRIVEDAFVLAARHIDDVTDASQVRPWLLAIARDRALSDDEAGELQISWGAGPAIGAGQEVLGTGDLRRWAREAGATLALADQAVLELSTRHDLDPDQLACAIGCDPTQLDTVVSQVDGEADEVLGALVVARQGRKDCPELAAELEGWDGVPAVEVAEQAAAHIPGCERCTRRRALIEPRRLVATAPKPALPTALRGGVLDAVAAELAAAAGRRAAGEPSPAALALAAGTEDDGGAGAPGSPQARAAEAVGAVGAAVAGVAGVAGVTVAAARAGDDTRGAAVDRARAAYETSAVPPAAGPPMRTGEPPDDKDGPPWMVIVAAALAVSVLIAIVALAVRGSPKTSLATVSATTVPPPSSTSPPSTAATVETLAPLPSTTTGVSTTTIPAGGHLQLDSTAVELGSTSTSGSVLLSNRGPGAVAWKASPGASWLSVSPASGTLKASSSVTVTVTIDRSKAPAGTFSVQVGFVATGNGSVGAVLTVSGSQTAQTTTTAEATTTTEASGPTTTGAAPTSTTAAH